MKLLVTGGAGYIGSIVAAQLLDAGHDVTVLDSLERGHAAAIPEGAPLEQVDLLDAEAVNATLAEGYDAVLHFAALALVAESVEHPERYHRGNFVATLNLLDAMRDGRLQAARVLLHLRGLRRARPRSRCPRRCAPTRSTPTAPPSSRSTA